MWWLPSHMDSGMIFGLLGLWHVYSVLRSYILNPKGFKSRAWFPAPLPGRFRALELWILLFIVSVFIIKQLSRAASDVAEGVIHTEHLMRFQHVAFALMYLIYICVGLINEHSRYLPLPEGSLQGTFALGFLFELIVFHFGHHPGVDLESYVHMLMQLILAALVVLMFLEIRYPSSIIVATARSMCLTLKGTWFFYIGVLINVPSSIPLGCSIPVGESFPSCEDHMGNRRAKAIQVLIFLLQAMAVVAFTFTEYGGLRFLLRHAQDQTSYEEVEGEMMEDNPQVYYVVDKDGDFADEVDKAGVPILKDMPRSFSRRLSKKSERSTPVVAGKDPTIAVASPLNKNLLMVQSPLPKAMKNV